MIYKLNINYSIFYTIYCNINDIIHRLLLYTRKLLCFVTHMIIELYTLALYSIVNNFYHIINNNLYYILYIT